MIGPRELSKPICICYMPICICYINRDVDSQPRVAEPVA